MIARFHTGETGWRINGPTCWLWCFANAQVCYYMIDRSRGSPALQAFFTDAFDGTLVHDFWAPDESIAVDDRQYCLVHLLRELEKVDQHNAGDEWRSFAKRLRRHWDHLFTFLDKPKVPFDNHLAERAIRPAVFFARPANRTVPSGAPRRSRC